MEDSKLMVLTLMAAGGVFARVSIGVRIGAPPAARVIVRCSHAARQARITAGCSRLLVSGGQPR